MEPEVLFQRSRSHPLLDDGRSRRQQPESASIFLQSLVLRMCCSSTQIQLHVLHVYISTNATGGRRGGVTEKPRGGWCEASSRRVDRCVVPPWDGTDILAAPCLPSSDSLWQYTALSVNLVGDK